MMNTKVVYDVISSPEDIYLEQVWASAWSLKHYNPHAHVMLLTDKATEKTLHAKNRIGALLCFDEVKVIEFDKEYNNKEKSRWIKTRLRRLVEGDFLFIDADTIITGALDGVDELCCKGVGAVLDHHCHSNEICEFPIFNAMYIEPMKRIFNVDYLKETDVYNSGVLFVKDSPIAYDIFDAWHENWLLSCSMGECRDQLSLTKTIQDLGNPIENIPGIYNCQIRLSIEFFFGAKIIHTFASQKENTISEMLGIAIYQEIKRNGEITANVADVLLHCKESFKSPTFLVDKSWLKMRFTHAYMLMENVLEPKDRYERCAYAIINFCARVLTFLLRIIHDK